MVSLEKQVDFITYLQRIFIEGDFVATYKFALLHSIADLCVEKQDISEKYVGYFISIDQLVEKFIELYWQHALPYSETNASPFLLLQNTGNQSALIRHLAELRNNGFNSITEAKLSSSWKLLKSDTKRVLINGPLWRLQILSGSLVDFLYPHILKNNGIFLNEGIGFCFRKFHDLIISMVRGHWINKIREYPANRKVLGDKANLADFLFGTNRQNLSKAQSLFYDLQQGVCFYCQKPLKEKGEVDHFIPWARYPNDLGHNFVLAHHKCNNNKRAYLPALAHRERWFNQNVNDYPDVITEHLGQYFSCDVNRSTSVVNWAYQIAMQTKSKLWLNINEFTLVND